MSCFLRASGWALVSHWRMCQVHDAYLLLCPGKNTKKATESTNKAQTSKWAKCNSVDI